MKKLIFMTLVLSIFASCLPQPEPSTASSGTGTTDDGTTVSGGGDDNSGGGSDSGTGDTGTGDDGGGDTSGGFPVHNFNIFLAGGQPWFPQDNTAPLTDTFINLQEAAIAFQTDGILRVRLKVKPQVIPPVNETYCYGRNTGAGFTPYYSSLKFDLSLRDITCPGGGTSCAPSQYILGSAYRRNLGIGPVSVDGYSEIIDVGALANQGVVATTVEITNVRSDQFCASNGSFCPAERMVRTQDCFNMELQVQTSYTQSL